MAARKIEAAGRDALLGEDLGGFFVGVLDGGQAMASGVLAACTQAKRGKVAGRDVVNPGTPPRATRGHHLQPAN
jgi:hypothetical protein